MSARSDAHAVLADAHAEDRELLGWRGVLLRDTLAALVVECELLVQAMREIADPACGKFIAGDGMASFDVGRGSEIAREVLAKVGPPA